MNQNCVSVLDVAAYVLEKIGPLNTLKLQKLVYYSQAWSLVWDDSPLFSDRIEAWANGPVCPALFNYHRGRYEISQITGGDASKLSPAQKRTIDSILGFYGEKPSHWLSELTHLEDPWKNARAGIPAGMRSNNEITIDSMAEYYGNL